MTLRRGRGAGTTVPLRRTDETEVKSTLRGLARRHDMTVAEVARKLEAGLWSREHCLGGMRLQWTFEKMCEKDRFAEPAAEPPRASTADDRDDPRAA